VRGGIVDIFSWQAQLPVRAEFFDDEIESLREFDIDTQTSVRNLQSVDILLGAAEEQGAQVRDYIAKDHLRIAIEPQENDSSQILIGEGSLGRDDGAEDFSGAFYDADVHEFAVGDFMLVEAKRAQFAERLAQWKASGERIVIYSRLKERSSASVKSWPTPARSTASSSPKERSAAASPFPPASSSSSQPRSYSAAPRRIGDAVCTAPRSSPRTGRRSTSAS
jgi:transcription-repair coupling factor (superfamily II helicase)